MRDFPGRRSEAGVALVLVLLIVTALSLASVALLSQSSRTLAAHAITAQQVQCQNVADLGLVEGRQSMPAVLDSLLGAGAFLPVSEQTVATGTVPMGAGTAAYLVTARGGDTAGLAGIEEQDVILRSACGFGRTRVVLESEGRLGMRPLFEHAACGCEKVDYKSDATLDGYDSTLGAYESQSPSSDGHLGSNDEMKIDMEGTITGSVTAGGEIDFDDDGTILGPTVAGEENEAGGLAFQSPRPRPCSCSEYDLDTAVAAAAASNDNGSAGTCTPFFTGSEFKMEDSETCTFPSGTYYFTKIEVKDDASMLFAGPVTMFWDEGDGGEWKFKTSQVVNASETAGDLQIFSRDDDRIKIEDETLFSGYIYAPYSKVELKDDAVLYGAVIAEEFKADDDTFVHFDRNVRREGVLPGTWVPHSWKATRF